ncbi:hypothetical protein N3K66_004101 [Trichothecium roseum]|uniref:Uncharacterized protein n=1 Tax=Trichothecium roseum TaxID=47278 RepID=A0ACC0V1R7_9HYPO|nr:hypothetical protein N3K66_004101 [Trichothecium roseum]
MDKARLGFSNSKSVSSAMIGRSQLQLIEENPIRDGLGNFRASFNAMCEGFSVPCTPVALEQFPPQDLRNLITDLLIALQTLPVSRLLPSSSSGMNLVVDLSRLTTAVNSFDFSLEHIRPLLRLAIADATDDIQIWNQVYNVVTESTPPPRQIASSLQQAPWLRNPSSFANSSEHRIYVDNMLKEEVGAMYVGLPDFHNTYFGGVADLELAAKAFWKRCVEGDSSLFDSA